MVWRTHLSVRRGARLASAVALAGVTAALLPVQQASALDVPSELSLGAVAVAAPLGPLPGLPAANRTSFLAIDAATLVSTLDQSAATGIPVGVDLFPDVHVHVAGEWDGPPMTDGTRAWLGHTTDGAGGGDDASLVLRPDGDGLALSLGTIWHDGVVFELRRVAANVVAVVDVADGAFETNDPEHPTPGTAPMSTVDTLGNLPTQTAVDFESVSASDTEAAEGSGGYVDVLVLYTPAAAGAADVVARAKQYVANGNFANAQDGIGWKFRLVRIQQLTFTEHKNLISQDLSTIQASASIGTIRANYAADVVALLGTGYSTTNQSDMTPSAPVCGLGYQNDASDASQKAYGFSVWDVSTTKCASTTGVHEIGHNMTLRHDWANSNGTGSPYTYNHGYTSIPGDFSTIMAYSSPACPGGSCANIPYWSNPNKTYGTAPQNFARGMATSTPTPAYDALAINQAASGVKGWMNNPNPFGSLDSVTDYPNGVKATGWAIDPDRRTGAINVQVTVDGVVASTGTANVYRGDVEAAHPSYGGNHGFVVSAPANGGTHTVCVNAVNVSYGTTNTQLPSCKTVTVQVNPVGDITGYTRIPGGARVYGWALDPDVTSAVTVHMQVDGVTQKLPTANLSSPTPPSTWADWGPNHGFSTDLTMSSGVAHNVCAVVTNIGEGVDTNVNCMSITLSGNPVGSYITLHNTPGGLAMEGWALDPDTADSIDVKITVDGVLKPDLFSAGWDDYPPSSSWSAYGPYHSFYAWVENLSSGTHTICVTAINVGGGANTSLGCKSLYYDHNPVGAFTATRTAANVVSVSGWALDPDRYESTTIKVVAAGITGPAVSASGSSSGTAQYPTSEYGSSHGFSTSAAVGLGTSEQVCVIVTNIDLGVDTNIGCKYV